MDFTEKTIHSEKIFSGRVINLRVDTVQTPNGGNSTREIVEHPGGVGIIPINEKNEVLMVRQFRKPVEEVCLEIPAGKLNYGEDPLECGIRELEEETGYKAKNVQSLGNFYTTPGFSNEVLHIYMATGLYKGELNLDEDEFVEVEAIPLNKLHDMVMSGEIRDAKSIIAILKAYELMK
jgi:ADP-ribose pyrophosphatase